MEITWCAFFGFQIVFYNLLRGRAASPLAAVNINNLVSW